ncbi:hypothetical protein A2U01_0090649, partial [Trifolium medium]|nr:hypothetical protein [Trifolium medium]
MHNTSRSAKAGESWRKSYRKFSPADSSGRQLASLSQERRPATSGDKHAEQSFV